MSRNNEIDHNAKLNLNIIGRNRRVKLKNENYGMAINPKFQLR